MSGSSLAAASSASSFAAYLSTSSYVHGCTGEKVGRSDWTGEKVGRSDWTGVGVSSLSKNPPVVSLLVSSGVELDGGRRVWQGVEI